MSDNNDADTARAAAAERNARRNAIKRNARALENVSDVQKAIWPNRVFTLVDFWFRATENQATRVLAEGATTQDTDAALFALALRNLLRAVDLVIATVPASAETLRRAKDRFDKAAPGVIDARDVIDHFDEYEIGSGNLQWHAEWTGKEPIWMQNNFYAKRPGKYTVNLGGGHEIDIAAGMDAARDLHDAALEVLLPE